VYGEGVGIPSSLFSINMKRKIIKGWIRKNTIPNDIICWVKRKKNVYVIHNPYMFEICKTKKDAIQNFGKNVTRVTILVHIG